MADKDQAYPLAPAVLQAISDEESLQAKELRRKKNIKYLGYAIIFIVFQIIVITVFAVVVMKIKTPDFKVKFVTIENFNSDSTAVSPSFSMRLIARVTVKNKNFGHYKYENTTATVLYGGSTVGQTLIPNGRAKARNTRKMNITMDITSTGNSNLSSDLGSGNLTLSTYAKLSGKVKVMMIMKKRKTAEMSCTMTYIIASNSVQDLSCK